MASPELQGGERSKKLRAKNIVVGLVLVGFVLLFYFVSIVRMSGA